MLNGCADCMFTCFSCGTMKMCPGSATAKIVLTDGGAKMVDNTICFCLAPSPIP